jgi:hypothetical protein
MADIRVPLFGAQTSRDENLDKDQRFVNCFPEKLDEENVYVVKRPGLDDTTSTSDTAEARGVFSWSGDLYSVHGNSLYKNGSEVGTNVFSTSSGRVDFAVTADSTEVLAIRDSGDIYTTNGSAVTTLSDGDIPASMEKGLVLLNRYLFALDNDRNITNSNLGDSTAWTAGDSIQANLIQDTGRAIARHINYIVYFGSESTLFYSDVGNPAGSPLKLLGGTGLLIGCANGDTVVNVERTVIWVAQAHGGGRFIAALEGLQPISLSTKPIEEVLDKEGSNISNAYAFTVRIMGHSFYVLTLPTTAQKTLVYDITEGVWSEWTSDVSDTETYFTGVASTLHSGAIRIQDEDNGKIYTMNPSTFRDNTGSAETIKVEGTTNNWDGGTRAEKFIWRLTVIGDQDGTDATNLSVSDTDDDYATFSTARTIDLNDKDPSLTRWGSTKRRAWKYTFQNNRPMRISSFELEVTSSGIKGI